jgi:hypothetical protein
MIPGGQSPAGGGPQLEASQQMKRILRAVRKNRFTIAILGAAGLILAAGVATLIPDLYEAKTLVVLRERELIDDSNLLKALRDKPLAQKEQTLAEELKSFAWILAHDFVLRARKNWIGRSDGEYQEFHKRQLASAEQVVDKKKKAVQEAQRNLETFDNLNDVSFILDENSDAKLKAELQLKVHDLQGEIKKQEREIASF